MRIELGVIDNPYESSDKTTGDVAQILEAKYHIIGIFVEVHKADIQRILERSFVTAFEEMAIGLPPRPVHASALQEIQVLMKRWLSTQEVERQGIIGVPTLAALMGVNHRFRSGLNRVSMKQFRKGARQGVRRPSFIDTGLYQASLKAWEEMNS